MSKLIRRTKKNFGAALLIALQMLTLTLAGLLMPFAGGPQQQPANQPSSGSSRTTASQEAPAGSQVTADQCRHAQMRTTKLP